MGQKMLGVTSALKSMEALAKRLLATDVRALLLAAKLPCAICCVLKALLYIDGQVGSFIARINKLSN